MQKVCLQYFKYEDALKYVLELDYTGYTEMDMLSGFHGKYEVSEA